jgi:hypothetical protein
MLGFLARCKRTGLCGEPFGRSCSWFAITHVEISTEIHAACIQHTDFVEKWAFPSLFAPFAIVWIIQNFHLMCGFDNDRRSIEASREIKFIFYLILSYLTYYGYCYIVTEQKPTPAAAPLLIATPWWTQDEARHDSPARHRTVLIWLACCTKQQHLRVMIFKSIIENFGSLSSLLIQLCCCHDCSRHRPRPAHFYLMRVRTSYSGLASTKTTIYGDENCSY